jgi:transposase InsO family protein
MWENRVARIMHEASIRSRAKRESKAATNTKYKLPVAPNLLNQHFHVDTTIRVRVADLNSVSTFLGQYQFSYAVEIAGSSLRTNNFVQYK